MQRDIRLKQGTIHYRETGPADGPPVVFVHGLLVNGALWRKVVPELDGELRCIVPDWPLGSHEIALERGADRTPAGMADLIADFIAALDLEDVTLVANDTGGALSQIMVTRRPERIGRLVLTPCDAFDNFLPKMFRPLQHVAKIPGALLALSQPSRLPAVRRPIYGVLTKESVPDEITAAWALPPLRDSGVRRDVLGLLKTIHPRYTLDAAAKLSAFDRPVLIAWGPEDRFFPFEHAERLAAILPDARVERVDGARTFISEDQPVRLAGLIRDFVSEQGPAPGSTPRAARPAASSPAASGTA